MGNKYWKLSKQAQQRFRRHRACDRKRRFETEEEAQIRGQDVYRCKYCDGWHRTQRVK